VLHRGNVLGNQNEMNEILVNLNCSIDILRNKTHYKTRQKSQLQLQRVC